MTYSSKYILTIVVAKGLFEENCHIITCPHTKETAIVDPGTHSAEEVDDIIKIIKNNSLRVIYIINTHGHLDHIFGNKAIKEYTQAKILVHEKDAPMLLSSELNSSAHFGTPIVSPSPDLLLKHNDVIKLGTLNIKVLHTPGHTMGGISLYAENFVITGDTLFKSEIGRTDLYGGNYEQEIISIKEHLLTLPDNTIVFPGHGACSTIADEKKYNNYLK